MERIEITQKMCKDLTYRTAAEIADMVGCCVRSIYNMIDNDEINYIVIGNAFRIPVFKDEWENYVEKCRQQGKIIKNVYDDDEYTEEDE